MPEPLTIAPGAAVESATVSLSQGAVTAAQLKTSKQIKAAAVGDAESVRQWYKFRVLQRAESRLRPKYEGSYVPWCEEQGIVPKHRIAASQLGDAGEVCCDVISPSPEYLFPEEALSIVISRRITLVPTLLALFITLGRVTSRRSSRRDFVSWHRVSLG